LNVKRPKRWVSANRLVEIRDAAMRQLRAIDYDGGAVDVEAVAANLGAHVRYAPYEGDLAGMLIRAGGDTYIAVNSAHHKNRQRFTTAHECGHLIFHHEPVFVDRSFSVLRRDENSSTAEDIMEIEANQFAAELLMPIGQLKRELIANDIDLEDDDQISRIAKRYAVSMQAMSYRIANLFLPRTW
jgi:Zn-dependent peptidase ImmA (M78 family)